MSQVKENLRVTLIQSSLHWQAVDANLAMFEEKIWQIDGKTDIIILPEMFNTGFTMNAPAVAEPMNLTTFKWMKQQAAQTDAVVMGSLVINDGGKFYNRLIWMQPDGTHFTYDKKHLFRLANEHHAYTAGTEKLIVTWKGWKICPLICYDLRFPVWSRNVDLEYDCLIYIASWPSMRANAWNILLKARAVENLSYCIGVNRVGEDGNGYPYNGCSSAIDPQGNTLFYQEDEEVIHTVALNYSELQTYREKLQFYLDADAFELT
ncbi:MAG: amidohydrolase [Flammeovirgaceae bacterium]